MNIHRLLLLQGYYTMVSERLGIRCKPIEGNVTVIETVLGQYAFQGVIYVLGNDDVWQGSITDSLGNSKLEDVFFDELGGSLQFIKRYDRQHHYEVHYSFRKNPKGFWEGDWEIPHDDQGKSHLVLTEVDRSFFDLQRT